METNPSMSLGRFCGICQNYMKMPIRGRHCNIYSFKEQKERTERDLCESGLVREFNVGLTLYSVIVDGNEYSKKNEWELIKEEIERRLREIPCAVDKGI